MDTKNIWPISKKTVDKTQNYLYNLGRRSTEPAIHGLLFMQNRYNEVGL